MFLGFSGDVFAQDPHFSQFYGNPLYLNPALAGARHCPRAVLSYRNQWPGLDGSAYVTYAASYDQHIDALMGGVGVLAYRDVAGLGSLTTTQISGIYSYLLNVNRDFNVKFGAQAAWSQKKIDWSKLNFGDQIDARKGFVYGTQEVQLEEAKNSWDFSVGAFGWYKSSLYGGFAVHHLNQPDEGLNGEAKLPTKITVHAGGVIPLGSFGDIRKSKTGVVLSPNILFMKQQDFTELNLGMYLRTENIVGGLWYRVNDAIIVMVGYHNEKFNLGYSYDLTSSDLTNASAGSHEISLALNFACKKKKRLRYELAASPAF